MQIKGSLFHLIIIYIGLISVSVYSYLKLRDVPKTAYINSITLYNNFEMKQEYEKKLAATVNTRKWILDSLMMDLKVYNEQIKSGKADELKIGRFALLKQSYLEREKTFTEDNEKLKEEYNQAIWTQLNQYIKEFGQEHGYDYIFGADGSGNIMFASEAVEITKGIEQYANARYKGGAEK